LLAQLGVLVTKCWRPGIWQLAFGTWHNANLSKLKFDLAKC